jgi:excisionase family DNA binding protein
MKIEKYFSLREVGELLNVSLDCVRTQLEKRRLKFTKVGGLIRIAESDLDAFLARNSVCAYGESIISSQPLKKPLKARVPDPLPKLK